jgi:hypothetical protein
MDAGASSGSRSSGQAGSSSTGSAGTETKEPDHVTV